MIFTMSLAFTRSFTYVAKSKFALGKLGGAAMRAYTGPGADTVVATCTQKITDLLKPVKLKVTSSNDDPNGSHIQVECVSEAFAGKNIVQRQRLVYKAIWEELNGPVHAVDSIIAKTPQEAGL